MSYDIVKMKIEINVILFVTNLFTFILIIFLCQMELEMKIGRISYNLPCILTQKAWMDIDIII